MKNQNKTREEYDRLQAIRAWEAKLRTPSVCTRYWNEGDFEKWKESRRPLPPFEEWVKE